MSTSAHALRPGLSLAPGRTSGRAATTGEVRGLDARRRLGSFIALHGKDLGRIATRNQVDQQLDERLRPFARQLVDQGFVIVAGGVDFRGRGEAWLKLSVEDMSETNRKLCQGLWGAPLKRFVESKGPSRTQVLRLAVPVRPSMLLSQLTQALERTARRLQPQLAYARPAERLA